MKLKRLIKLILIGTISASLLIGCGKSNQGADSKPEPGPSTESSKPDEKPAEKPKVTVWANGSANVRTLFEELVAEFNSHPDYKDTAEVELQFVLSGAGEQGIRDRIIAAEKAGQKDTDFDLIALNADEVAEYTALGGDDIFTEIDKSKIPNNKNVMVESELKPECTVPYRGTTVVVAYDSEAVPNPPKTDKELVQWIKDNPGRFAYNPPGSGGAGAAFVRSALYNDLPKEAILSGDSKWIEEWGPGFDLLEEIHPHMYRSGGKVMYPNKNQGPLDLLANKEVDIIPAWADMVLTQLDQGILPERIKITQINPALTGTPVVFAIPSIAKNPENAYSFIDYVISPEGQDLCLNTIFAIPVVDFDILKSDNVQLIEDLDMKNFRFSSIGDLGMEMEKQWDENIATLK